MPTNKKRLSIVLPKEIEDALYDLRKSEPYNRMSLSEIIRVYFEKGRAADAAADKPA